MELKDKTLLFLGDSITEGHGVSGPDKTFWGLLAAREGAHCVGYGIGGTRIARQPHSTGEGWDRDFCGRVEEMQPEADVVVVFGGTNDFGHGDAPFGTMADRTPDTFYGALHTLYTSLLTRYPAADMVVMTPLHRDCEDAPRPGVRPLKEYVAAIREVAEFYSLPVLDLFSMSGIQPAVPVMKERYMPDGLHLNEAGHEILAAKLTAFLKGM